MGTAMGRTDYHGLNPHLPLVLSRKGYPFSLSMKPRTDAQGATTDYWAADSLQAYVTGLYRAAGTKGTSHSGPYASDPDIIFEVGDMRILGVGSFFLCPDK